MPYVHITPRSAIRNFSGVPARSTLGQVGVHHYHSFWVPCENPQLQLARFFENSKGLLVPTDEGIRCPVSPVVDEK